MPLLLVAILVAIVVLATLGRLWYRGCYYVTTDNAYVTGHVHPVSSGVAAQVRRTVVNDNQWVHAGDVVAELDTTDQYLKIEQVTAQIASAEQQVLQANARIAQAKAEAGTAEAQLEQSQAVLLRASQEAYRYRQLYNSAQTGFVSKAALETSTANLASATADLNAHRCGVAAAQAKAAGAIAERDGVRAQRNVLQAQLKEAQQQLAYHTIVAPASGRISWRNVEAGARVQPGQQLAAVVEDDVWVVANLKETQLAKLTPGQEVNVSVDAIPGHTLRGRVDSVAPASGAMFALLPPDNTTGNFTKVVQRVPVKISLRPVDIATLGEHLVPGESAVIEIALGEPVTSAGILARR